MSYDNQQYNQLQYLGTINGGGLGQTIGPMGLGAVNTYPAPTAVKITPLGQALDVAWKTGAALKEAREAVNRTGADRFAANEQLQSMLAKAREGTYGEEWKAMATRLHRCQEIDLVTGNKYQLARNAECRARDGLYAAFMKENGLDILP